jgi:hypothetical protein
MTEPLRPRKIFEYTLSYSCVCKADAPPRALECSVKLCDDLEVSMCCVKV